MNGRLTGAGGAGVDSARAPLRRRLFPRLGAQDLAIDLGTANTLVFVRGEGIVVSEPSVVAIDSHTGDVHAVGEEAQGMIGRTPATITAVRPLRHGVIADFEVTEQMLRHFIGRVHRSRLAHPRVMICAPSGITDVEQRALMEACLAAGARSVHLIEESLAAAIGAGLAIGEPRANVVVDVGGGTSEVAVISLGGIVVSRSLRTGGYDLDETVAAWLRNTHGLAIGETTAERVKLEVGGVDPGHDRRRPPRSAGATRCPASPARSRSRARRCAARSRPRCADIVTAVKEALEETPPELASDISERGILLAGGGALLRGFAERLETRDQRAGGAWPTRRSPAWRSGRGQALDEIELLERMSAGAHSRRRV